MTRVAPLLSLHNVTKYFHTGGRRSGFRPERITAVDDVSVELLENETLALVGESGSGKTTTARMVLRLERPSSGRVIVEGANVHDLRGRGLKEYRRTVQAVFQDPWSSFSPRARIGYAVSEPLIVNTRLSKREIGARVEDLLEEVGLERDVARLFPHELSGGMRQRAALARALGLTPKLIVLDEPVSALDVSIRAQIMNLLKDLQERHRIAYLLIAHDLATVRYLSNHIAVMYAGRVVERAPAEELFANALHPYTQALLKAADPECALAAPAKPAAVEVGVSEPDGAHDRPALRHVGGGHFVACHPHNHQGDRAWQVVADLPMAQNSLVRASGHHLRHPLASDDERSRRTE